ncbi:DUF3298 domain-containing protein [Hymenobacter sp. BT664]|uniref:DUF3298 domain-containing protein n=1 Tax=Hymenobacter montanus TaxID=2771359 RepID=A0A927BHV2_9BACT|nr:DUF3298 and DUF4163 domain-containing protein [Hymenobacter montanus]MBD2770535.1 DUF3298 domain-containing protein [Hymenobacter montanus]
MRFFSGATVALAVGLLLPGCHSDTQPATTTAPPAISGVVLSDSPGASYRIYQGLLPGSADTITLHLLQRPHQGGDFGTDNLVASYHRADGHPYKLVGHSSVAGRSSAPADSVLLFDVSPELANDQQEGPTWRLLRQGRILTGSYNNQPVRLQEAQPLKSLAFAVRCFTDSIIAFPGIAKSPVARISLQALLPKVPTPTLTANILHDLRGDSLPNQPALQLPQLWARQRTDYQKTYREDAQAARRDLREESPETPFGYGLNYEQHQATYVFWNQAPLLSLAFYTYSYSGGAHGGYGTQVVTYDTRTGQHLRFADIFRPGTEAQLSQLLEQAVRRTLHITGQSLEERLNVGTMPVTRNVCLTGGGAVFVYAPYEIASYADGEISLFISQANLQPLMVPSAAGLLSKAPANQNQ